ncbi:hypothetical protein E2C01_013425 [Portunus trituberculatus]|uniref:Uncharacterized protein n=1 Tax=Portunus trituberculatus TaxID=210409 RepID=A0A5B7DGM0_PORTR|nr:hypothetical protein [Portunus trituberculatus]
MQEDKDNDDLPWTPLSTAHVFSTPANKRSECPVPGTQTGRLPPYATQAVIRDVMREAGGGGMDEEATVDGEWRDSCIGGE